MLQVFSCQATVEHRAQQQSCGGVGALIMASGIRSNLTTFPGEKTLCINFFTRVSDEVLQLLGAQGHWC